ncbi:uncharacterized protein RHIMIDRAFT_291247 [Rhizopus microsporus ATCC 52813]|uniref:Uncharacterized protein n=1 Tax=Rhizopus microsporus ATCC 52813 TaxID=1340429 RepID=A0A2G4SXP8_RHIZD|nr:uncharacterized protein RHIMIDRAFT_291247 [Rhizopus microsporus ATCC 52813]PHZ13549.1 hypothetical protein RHIMIDRAFT_291247 [Rhizopus microsporus ATCC 52813]
MPITNISDSFTIHIIPEYDDEVTTSRFANEADFEEWFSNIAQKHANWSLRQSWTNEKAKSFLGQSLAITLRLNTIKTKKSIKIEEHVNQNMVWKSIKDFRRMDEARLLQIEQNDISSSFSPSLRISYYDVRDVINARLMKLRGRAILELVEKGAKTLLKVHEDGPFFASWAAKWQMKVFVTDHEIIPTLRQWLNWLKDNVNLNVKRIMVDCSPTEIAAIREVFDNHIKRSWETHIKRDVKINKSTQETKLVRDDARANLNSMMYSETPEVFNLAHQLFLVENEESEVFLVYFSSLWLPKKELWFKAWRQFYSSSHLDITFHFMANNFVWVFIVTLGSSWEEAEVISDEEDHEREAELLPHKAKQPLAFSFSQSKIISEIDVKAQSCDTTDKETSACTLIVNTVKLFLPFKEKHSAIAHQSYFCIWTNGVLKYAGYSKFTMVLHPSTSFSSLNALHLDARTLYQLLAQKLTEVNQDQSSDQEGKLASKLVVYRYDQQPITSLEFAWQNKDAAFNAIINMDVLQTSCRSYGLGFAYKIICLPGLTITRILGTQEKAINILNELKKASYE